MDKFLIKRPRSCSVQNDADDEDSNVENSSIRRVGLDFNPDDIISDPGDRVPIESYDAKIREQVRRAYLAKGPYQPKMNIFPKNQKGRSFQKNWFKDYDWLEYSVSKDEAYCLWCYLFKSKKGHQPGRGVFTSVGFNNWKKALEVFKDHVGLVGSFHNEAAGFCRAFKNQRQSISHVFLAQGYEIEIEYRKRLTATLSVIRMLLRQGLPFRGHDESVNSLNKGNFLEFLDWHCREKGITSGPGNCQLTSPKVQKELVSACANETRALIFADIGECVRVKNECVLWC